MEMEWQKLGGENIYSHLFVDVETGQWKGLFAVRG